MGKKLGQGEEQLRLVLDSTAEAIYGIDTKGACTFCNASCLRLLGYQTPEDLLGKNMHALIHHTRPDGTAYPETDCPIFHAFRLREGIHVDDEVLWRSDGTSFYAEYWSYFIRQGTDVLGAVVTFFDITERRTEEQALRESEERYRELFENALDIIYTQDMAGNITSVNKVGEDLSGYTREELLHMNIAGMVAPEHLLNIQEVIQLTVAGEKRQPLEIEILTRDGRRLAIEMTRQLMMRDGKPVGVLTFGRDITEHKRLEAQFYQSQKMEAVGRLAGGIAHDFNNLLNVILGYGGFLSDIIGSSEPQRRYVAQINSSADRGVSLIRQLLAFSRKQVLQPKILDLNAVARETEPLVRHLIGEDIEVIILPEPSLGHVKADPGQIQQVLMNLVVNARDAMPEGGKLTIASANVDFDEHYARHHSGVKPGSFVMLAVSDTGIGMDQETQAHIFEPFFTTKALGKGTGLGLSTAYGILKQSQGYIWVYSELGKGTTFKVYLPLVQETCEDTQRDPIVTGSLKGVETVLLVEDEPSLRELAREFLESSGYRVLEAGDGAKAIELAEQHRESIHLLLTDVIMPGMNGHQLAEHLTSRCPEMRVIYTSGYTDNVIVNHGVLRPGTAFIEKPYMREALLTKIREVLDQGKPLLSSGS